MPARAWEALPAWELTQRAGGLAPRNRPSPILPWLQWLVSSSALEAPPGSSAPACPSLLALQQPLPGYLGLPPLPGPSHKPLPVPMPTFSVTTSMFSTWTSPASYLVFLPVCAPRLASLPKLI